MDVGVNSYFYKYLSIITEVGSDQKPISSARYYSKYFAYFMYFSILRVFYDIRMFRSSKQGSIVSAFNPIRMAIGCDINEKFHPFERFS